MSTSTDGILAYGYDLGGDDAGWKVEGLGEYDEWPSGGWYDPEVDDADFTEAVENTLLTAHGFTLEWVPGADNSAYRAGREAARTAIGVEAHGHCSGESAMYLLSAKAITAYRGHVETIDWPALERERVEQDWDGKLAAALSVLALTPIQPEPRWLLVSYWG